MKHLTFAMALMMLLPFTHLKAQVKTDFNNENTITQTGVFSKSYKNTIDFVVPAKDISRLLELEEAQLKESDGAKPFRLAVPQPVDLNIAKLIEWVYDGEMTYGKYTIKLDGALSTSINFDRFFLPKGTEMYVYNEIGDMITGPVTDNENNAAGVWGSWVYKGGYLIVEIKTPASTINELLLHSNNVAYGYKEVYRTKAVGFGNSGPCEINVLCPLGSGWEQERNSVGLILSANGSYWCSGSIVMKTCSTNQPFFLTANHCFQPSGLPQQDVTKWRFNFQDWSPVCSPSQNASGITYNGSTLRANWANSDFCLVELANTPPSNSGINYAGWTRSATPAQNATGIHHPAGDVMKISKGDNPVTIASAFGTTNQHWRVNWSPQSNGAGQTVIPVTEPGSSGSPLFDQNHRIIGQLHGGPSFCGGTRLWDYYGRFDLSWTGGGTNATRLSNWLDPSGSGATTTNTTSISSLSSVPYPNLSSIALNPVFGEDCNSVEMHTNSPSTVSLTWTTTGGLRINGNASPQTITRYGNI